MLLKSTIWNRQTENWFRTGPVQIQLETVTGTGLDRFFSGLDRFFTGWTYYPGKEAGGFVLGHQLSLVRSEQRPLGDVWIHAANIHLVSLSEDLQT